MVARIKTILPFLPHGFAIMLCTAGYSMLDYYYVTFAQTRGLTQVQGSFVIAVFKASMIVGLDIGGRLVSQLDHRRCVTFFLFLLGVSDALVTVIYWCKTFTLFYAVSFVVYCIRAITCGIVYQFLLSPLIVQFEKSIFRITAIFEALWGFGVMASIGTSGALIDLWAFPLPYFCFSIFTLILLPWFHYTNNVVFEEKKKSTSDFCDTTLLLRKLMRSSKFWCCILSSFMCYTVLGFNGPTLEQFIKKSFHVSTSTFGIIVILHSAFYCIGCVIFAMFPNEQFPSVQCVVSMVFSTAGIALQGPLSIFPYKPNYASTLISFVLTGLGSAGHIVCAIAGGVYLAGEFGYSNDIAATGKVVGITCQPALFGIMLAPMWTSVLMEHYTYRFVTNIICAVFFVATLVIVFCLFSDHKRKKQCVTKEIDKKVILR